MSILIKSARLLNPKSHQDKICDIFIEEGIVSRIEGSINAKADMLVDASSMWAAPGLIDVHCHLREPGFEYKETIASGTKSAAIGGFTTICCMANTNPVTDSLEAVSFIINKAKDEGVVNVLPIGAITKGIMGTELTCVKSLVKAGACAISDDGKTVLDEGLMLKGLQAAREVGVPVLCHCEDPALSKGGVMSQGEICTRMGLPPISYESEEVIIARDLELAEKAGTRLHICHLSTNGGVNLVRQAKQKGYPVTAEVCPHHFSLTDKEVLNHGANAKMAPPLRSDEDVDALIRGLTDGTIDVIATDHAPHSKEEKEKGIKEAPFGIVGFETALALGITNLVNKGFLTPLELIEKMSYNPARLLNLDRGSLEEGKTADIVIIDHEFDFTVNPKKFQSKNFNCPYGGMKLKGKVFANIVSGKAVVNNYKGIWE